MIACENSLDSVTFGTTVSTDDWYTGYCQDTLRFYSTYTCGQRYCSPEEIKSGLAVFQESCDEVDLPIPSYYDFLAKYTAEDLKTVPMVAHDDVFEEAVNNTVIPNQELFDLAVRSWVSMLQQREDLD